MESQEWCEFQILNEMLQRCDTNALVGVVKSLYVMLEAYQSYPEEIDELHSDVKDVVHKALHKMQVDEKIQQDADQNAFSVVLGASVAAGKQAGSPERVSTGLLVVGSDVLSFISTFLSREKVKFMREWKATGDGVVRSCHISPCSRMILTSSGPDLHLWDAASGLLKSTLKGHTSSVWSCRFFPDGKTVVSASSDRTLKVWDVASGSLVRSLVGHTSYVLCVDVSPDNTRVLSGSFDGSWKLWNSRTGELQHACDNTRVLSASYCCSFSPNGSLFLVGCGTHLRLHNSTTYQLQRTVGHRERPHGGTVMSCSFAPDGATILSGSNDRTMKLWSTTTGLCLRTLDGHSGPVISCSFSPSGHEICSASGDGTLKMWGVAAQTTEIFRLQTTEHFPPVTIDTDRNRPWSICASSDGKRILSGHGYGTVKMWRVGWGGGSVNIATH
jgi:WD40 repeat protein